MRKKVSTRKHSYNRTTTRKTKRSKSNLFWWFLVVCFLGVILYLGYHYRGGLAYYLGFKSNKINSQTAEEKRISDIRNVQVLEKSNGKSVGIDVSEYQGKISWSYVDTLEQQYPIQFVFIRATVGKDRKDRKFDQNWAGAKKNKMIRGAYHYYRPNENSIDQARLFIKTVSLQKGDLPPVVDLEKLPKNQSIQNLKLGLRRWLQAVEAHYQVKPIIYTGERYYDDFLKEEFSDYLFWIANYNFYREEMKDNWLLGNLQRKLRYRE
jgi:lysozyme